MRLASICHIKEFRIPWSLPRGINTSLAHGLCAQGVDCYHGNAVYSGKTNTLHFLWSLSKKHTNSANVWSNKNQKQWAKQVQFILTSSPYVVFITLKHVCFIYIYMFWMRHWTRPWALNTNKQTNIGTTYCKKATDCEHELHFLVKLWAISGQRSSFLHLSDAWKRRYSSNMSWPALWACPLCAQEKDADTSLPSLRLKEDSTWGHSAMISNPTKANTYYIAWVSAMKIILGNKNSLARLQTWIHKTVNSLKQVDVEIKRKNSQCKLTSVLPSNKLD